MLRPGGWVPMREYGESEAVDFAIVGTGAGGGTLACKLAEHGFSVVALRCRTLFPAAGGLRIRRKRADQSSTGPTTASSTAKTRCRWAATTAARRSAASTVHFAMVSLRFRPEWFKSRSLLGYGADWPLDWREMWNYYAEVEQALKIAGPVTLSLGAAASALSLPRARAQCRGPRAGPGLRGDGHSAGPRRRWRRCRRRAGWRHPCVYRGFCVAGCSTNAKQSALVTWIPRAIAAGRGNPRPRDGRQDRGRSTRAVATGRALSSRRRLAFSARAQRRRCRLRDRDAAAAVELGDGRGFRTVSPTVPGWSARI